VGRRWPCSETTTVVVWRVQWCRASRLVAIFGQAVFWPRRIELGQRSEGAWSRIARRAVQRPRLTLGIGVAVFLALAAFAVGYSSSGFGGATAPPSGSDPAAGNAALAAHFPPSSSNPANLVLAYRQPVYRDPTVLTAARQSLESSGRFTALSGPLDANGRVLTPAHYRELAAQLGPPIRLPAIEPRGLRVTPSD
jgi:hypothetical protein